MEVKNIVNDTDEDEQIDSIILEALNHCYIFDLAKIDVNLKTTYAPAVNGLAYLPKDALNILRIEPKLEKGERRLGGYIMTDREVTFTILYNSIREPLTKPTDEPEIAGALEYAMILYGAYAYFNYRKKLPVADWYMQQYEIIKQKYVDEIENYATEEYVGDVHEFIEI